MRLFFIYSPLIILASFSCKKKVNCGEDYTLNSLNYVNEGETLQLTVGGFEDEINTYFYWDCPDMTPYTSLGPGGVMGSETFSIENFSIKDEGTYTVTVVPGGEGCESFTMSKTVTMVPKTCPCAEPAAINTLYYSPSYESQFTSDLLTATVVTSTSTGETTINFSGQNSFTAYFGKPLPSYSSTYNIVGGHNYFWDDSDDAILDMHFHLYGNNHGFDYFGFEENKELYLTGGTNQVTIQFCDLQVYRYYLGTDAFKLSGKFVVDL